MNVQVGNNNPLLKQVMEEFDFSNPPTDPLELVSIMAQVMIDNGGIGLAANQIGLPYRAFVLYADELIPVFNPKIVDFSEEMIILEEGCLSYPGLFVKIKRPRQIRARYTEPNGVVVTKTFTGMTARAFQHECDHLNGIIHTSRANRYHREQALKRRK